MKKIVLYLDNCCFNRPYDDQSLLSINIETQAKLAIQEFIKDNEMHFVWSFILDFENNSNPDEAVKFEIFKWKKISSKFVYKNDTILNTSRMQMKAGFGKKDALHIACAIDANVDFFVTVDKGILKKRNSIDRLRIVSPIEFMELMEKNNEK